MWSYYTLYSPLLIQGYNHYIPSGFFSIKNLIANKLKNTDKQVSPTSLFKIRSPLCYMSNKFDIPTFLIAETLAKAIQTSKHFLL